MAVPGVVDDVGRCTRSGRRARRPGTRGGASLLLVAALSGVLPSVLPARARADGELWTSFESELPVSESVPGVHKTSFRLISETRFRERSGGLGQMLLRPGLRFEVTDWFSVVAQPALYLERSPEGRFIQGVRAELEPTFEVNVGDLELADRNRIAYRWQTDQNTWYLRSQLRVGYAFGPVTPFLWVEPLFDAVDFEVDDFRVMAGMQVKLSESTDVEVGYLHRLRKNDDLWTQDSIAAIFVEFDGWD